MLNLPGSVLWFFLLVYFTYGQILDNANLNISNSKIDQVLIASNVSSIQRNEEEKENKTTVLSTDDDQNATGTKQADSLINKTATEKPRTLMNLTQELNRTEVFAVKNPRRRVTNRTSTPSNFIEVPIISAERRNSYLSIAERRKYYNRTRVQTKKVDVNSVEQQETTNRPVSSTTETVQVNEIHVIKKPITKDFSRVVTSEKNQTNNQRLFVSLSSNETYGKPQSTRQSVIQSQYQFGQKLNLRKSIQRTQDSQDERSKRKKEKSETEPMENSTNKLSKNYQTQSTKLVRIDKNLWPTTVIPKPNTNDENFIMHSTENLTLVEKLTNFITANNTIKRASTFGFDQHQSGIVTLQNYTHQPLPLNNLNGTKKNDSTTKTAQDEQLVKNLTKVGAQLYITENITTSESVLGFLNITTTVKTIITDLPNLNLTNKRSGKFSNYGVRKNQTILKSNLKNSTLGLYQTTPLMRVIPRQDLEPKTRVSQSEVDKKVDDQMSHSFLPVIKNRSSTEQYPLTIELNENNKRVLGEMFQTLATSEPKKFSKAEMTTSRLQVPEIVGKTTVLEIETESTSLPTTPKVESTSEDSQISPPDNHLEEEYRAQGSRYKTKFYIAPNVNGSQVIKVIEDDDDIDYGVESRPEGVAVYVLAVFGLVPLLLAFIFGTKFVIQRRQRQYECESDAKSELSTNETQIRKKKGFSSLKKSPSNVTTTTLVTTTRLPRVQHWENCDKLGNRNWEFPRSKLKLKTILGQGNFGQVWKAEAEDMVGHEGTSYLVAVKTVKEGATEKERTEFLKELEIMQQIGSHPNIVTLLGCCTDQEPYYLIMEYVKYGKLLTYLREHRVNENYYNFSDDSGALTSRDLTVFAYCVARGMEYLMSRGIIHRDLAARNVLVDHNKLCKIADFGMSRSVRDFENGQVYEERQHKGALPIRWMAPESLVYSVFTFKSDVWSFGIVMWEIVTLGSTPYPNMGAREVMRKVRDGYRLERPSHCKPEFYRLISHCWAHDPNKRPDFSELRHELGTLLDNPAKDGSYVDLDRFAIDNNFLISSKTSDIKLLERSEFKTLQKLGQWDREDWMEDTKRSRMKRGKNDGKGTVTLTGQGSFTVNSRILEKEFNII